MNTAQIITTVAHYTTPLNFAGILRYGYGADSLKRSAFHPGQLTAQIESEIDALFALKPTVVSDDFLDYSPYERAEHRRLTIQADSQCFTAFYTRVGSRTMWTTPFTYSSPVLLSA